MINFSKDSKSLLQQQIETRFDNFLEILEKQDFNKMDVINERRKDFFINNKINIPEVVDKIIKTIGESQISKILNADDINELTIKEDGLYFYLSKNNINLCRLKAEPNVIDLFNNDVIPKFSCELNSSLEKSFFDNKGNVSYEVYHSIHEDLLNENIEKCLKPIKELKKSLDFFNYIYHDFRIISGINDIDEIDSEKVKDNSMKLEIKNAIDGTTKILDINDSLLDNLKKYFSKIFRKSFDIKTNESFDSVLEKNQKIKRAVEDFKLNSSILNYDNALLNFNRKKSIKDCVLEFKGEINNEDTYLFAFIPYEIEINNLKDIEVYKIKDNFGAYEKSNYTETGIKLEYFIK